MACYVERDFLIYSTNGRNFFQVIIHLLITYNRQLTNLIYYYIEYE